MTKFCPKCNADLLVASFGNASCRKDGLACWCKECSRQSAARYRATKQGGDKHRQRERARHLANRETATRRAREYYARNREVQKEKNLIAGRKRYVESAEHRAREKVRGQEWGAKNRARANARARSGRLCRVRATPGWLSAIERAQVQSLYEIAAARNVQTGVKHHVDHVFAVKGRGWCGLHVPWNLQVLTQKENDQKWIKVPKEFEYQLWSPQKHLRSGT